MTPDTHKLLRAIVLAQCIGMLSILILGTGLILTDLSRAGVPSYQIAFPLSLLPLAGRL